jgi:hypothetical protein
MKCATQRRTCGAALPLLWSVLLLFVSSAKGVLAQSPYTCTAVEILSDTTCPFTYDFECDAGIEDNCSSVSDCFDCDPCREFDHTDCGTCTAAFCAWCGYDNGFGSCSSTVFATILPSVCTDTGGTTYTTTCMNPDAPNIISPVVTSDPPHTGMYALLVCLWLWLLASVFSSFAASDCCWPVGGLAVRRPYRPPPLSEFSHCNLPKSNECSKLSVDI